MGKLLSLLGHFFTKQTRTGLSPVIEGEDGRHSDDMAQDFSQLFAALKTIQLTTQEKQDMLRGIFAELPPDVAVTRPRRWHPVSLPLTDGHSLWQLIIGFRPMPAIAASLILVIVAGGGITYAAESAVPGKILYPIKVHVNEGVRARLALTERAKASWDAKLAERRLEEAEELQDSAPQNEDTHLHLQRQFERQVERTKRRISRLIEEGDTAGAATISTQFEASLKAHESVLTRMAEDRREIRTSVARIVKTIRSAKRDTAQVLADAATGAGLRIATEANVRQIEEALQEVRVSLADTGVSPSHDMQEATVKVEEVERNLEQAAAKMAEGAYDEAFAQVRNMLNEATETKLLLKNRSRFGVRAKQGGDVEGLQEEGVNNDEEDAREEKKENEREQESTDANDVTEEGVEGDHPAASDSDVSEEEGTTKSAAVEIDTTEDGLHIYIETKNEVKDTLP